MIGDGLAEAAQLDDLADAAQLDDPGDVDDAGDPDDLDDAAIPQRMDSLLAMTVDLEAPVAVTVDGATTSYALAGRIFAVATGRAFEAELGPEVAAAALRTPDVSVSRRGGGWIRLEPATIDDHAADRVIAWFELARRIAAGRRPTGGDRAARA